MKKEIGTVSAIPSKRLFLSIIADYDLNRSVCELIDNAIDLWVKGGKAKPVEINIDLEQDQQIVKVTDTAGGIPRASLSDIVAPGQTGNNQWDQIIGIFGVGSKRAMVALGGDIKVTTRANYEPTYRIEFDDGWLNDESWDLPIYEVDPETEGTTTILVQRLRFRVTEEAIRILREHLGATYARFLADPRVGIWLNGERIDPILFESWAFPPDYPPHLFRGKVKSADGGEADVEITAGLTTTSSPATGEYGVYLYCNGRLVARALKSYDVGYVTGLAGQPHPAASLARVIVSLRGPARHMPWNSSKSGINANHPIFLAIRETLLQVVTDYSSLSRRWNGQWEEQVFAYDRGTLAIVDVDDFGGARKQYLPPLPTSKPRFADRLAQANRDIAINKPWAIGLYEGVAAAEHLTTQRLSQKNRLILILLDSTLEIAFKEYLVNESGAYYSDQKLLDLFTSRKRVHDEIKRYLSDIDETTWKKITYYHDQRNKLVHERASVTLADAQLADFRSMVQSLLSSLYGLRFE